MLKKIYLPTFLVFLLTLLVSSPAQADNRYDLIERINEAHRVLIDMQANPRTAIPTPLIKRAKAVVYIDQFKAGFIVGLKGGHGIALLHNDNNGWSPPAFYDLGGASFGLQLGGEHRRIIALIMTREGTRVLTGNSGEIGVDAGAVAGPQGVNADWSNFTDYPILLYSVSQGAYAGATLKGAVLSPDNDDNSLFYGQYATALDVLESRVPMQKEAEGIIDTLKKNYEDGVKRENGNTPDPYYRN